MLNRQGEPSLILQYLHISKTKYIFFYCFCAQGVILHGWRRGQEGHVVFFLSLTAEKMSK